LEQKNERERREKERNETMDYIVLNLLIMIDVIDIHSFLFIEREEVVGKKP
jgi:hypothetical protein